MSVFHLSSFFSNISFFARGLVGLGVLIGAYFYSGRQKLLKNAAILFGCAFGALMVLRVLLGVFGVWAALLGWMQGGALPHTLY